MNKRHLINTNIEGSYPLPLPEEVLWELPMTESSFETVDNGRQAIRDLLDDKDRRLLLIVGPCSIHDTKAALEYAERLKRLADRVRNRFLIVIRVYFEKPRTTTGWKGLINDPFLNDSFHIEKGIKMARQLLLQLTEMGLPTATEVLDPIVPQYLSDLICWSAIGARTTESQTHREIASGLSMPVGFKNGTDGSIEVAINAMRAAVKPHHFLGIDLKGCPSVFKTRGNRHSHIVLRGGREPNYDPENIARCEAALEKAGLRKKILVDCSHGNSQKDFRRQSAVFESCIGQVRNGNRSIFGMMLESNLFEGNQELPPRLKGVPKLRYGVSITDACISWETTEKLIMRGVP